MIVVSSSVFSQATTPSRAFISYEQAQPTLRLLAPLRPPELKALEGAELEAVWPKWIARHDEDVRVRVRGGDDDSIVNLLLFGTSFTAQPRVTSTRLEAAMRAQDSAASAIDQVVAARLSDLVAAAADPRGNERLEYVAATLEQKGFSPRTVKGRDGARTYLLGELSRVLRGLAGYERAAQEARALGDPAAEFARRSKIYEGRGLSTDTSLAPNFGIEEALRQMRDRHLLPARIGRVAVVGPGLDFTDKQEGYDFYPPQAPQPFAVIDSLLRLKLASPDALDVTTLDVNPRVNAHLSRIGQAASKTRPYILQLPLDAMGEWSSPFLAYWAAFGGAIGTPAPSMERPANAGEVKSRAVAVELRWATRVRPVDVNVITQRMNLPPSQRFDLVVATNVFVYYNEFQQSLAMANIGAMMADGGILLTNNAVVELPGGPFRSIGTTTVSYSARPGDGDVIVWYRH